MGDRPEDAARAIIRKQLDNWRHRAETTKNKEERLQLAMDALQLWRSESTSWMQWALEIVRKNAPEQPSRQAELWFFLQFLQRVTPADDWDVACLPADLLAELTEALQALPFGEVQPILRPSPAGLHGPGFSLGLARLLAVEHVEFLAGKGLSKEAARESVATALGVTSDALRWWRNTLLPKGMAKSRLKAALRAARAAGKLALAMDRDLSLRLRKDGSEVLLQNPETTIKTWPDVDKVVVDALERHETLDLTHLWRDMQDLQRDGLLVNRP